MTLRGIVRVCVTASVVLLAALLGISFAAVSTTERAARAESRRSQSLRLADELRQTSDDLTRMARSYAVTGDPRFLGYFDEILAIRDGRAPRPGEYDDIYWDVVTSTGRGPRPSGPPVAFEVLAARAGFTPEELALLGDARERSDVLAVFEKEAFAAIESEKSGSSAGGHEQAHGLLWGQGYHDAKARIMEPIGQVLALVDARTRQETAEAAARAHRYSEAAVALVSLMLGGILFGAVGARRAVLRPVAALDTATKRIAAGDLEVQAPVGGVTEIAVLAVRFNEMTRSLRQEATTTARRTSELRSTVDRLRVSQGDLKHLSQHDVLTGLANRALFHERLQAALLRTGDPTTVMLIDLDGFKAINDSLGHAAGDTLLVTVARRLDAAVRPGDTAARLGGDEFAILAHGLDQPGAARLADRLLHTLDEPVAIEEELISARASLGIAVLSGEPGDRDLLREADAAMYEAKRKGGQRFQAFSPDLRAKAPHRLVLEGELRRAHLGSDLIVRYQPIVDLQDGGLSGLEATLQWAHTPSGTLPPKELISIAEETGIIVPIGLWVIEEACKQARVWSLSHPGGEPLGMSVNVAPRQLAEAGFVDDVARVLRETSLEPALLTLEVTETTMLLEDDSVFDSLHRLKQLGLRISIEDFGTGYSSLDHLRRFPVDEVKINRAFVASLVQEPRLAVVASATIGFARSLGLEVVAEGVETCDELTELRSSSCTRAQGPYLWTPMTTTELGDLLVTVVDSTWLTQAVLPDIVAPDR